VKFSNLSELGISRNQPLRQPCGHLGGEPDKYGEMLHEEEVLREGPQGSQEGGLLFFSVN